jgi:hypothetical protein
LFVDEDEFRVARDELVPAEICQARDFEYDFIQVIDTTRLVLAYCFYAAVKEHFSVLKRQEKSLIPSRCLIKANLFLFSLF